jgi:transcriptional regulator of nitric oxide reductase
MKREQFDTLAALHALTFVKESGQLPRIIWCAMVTPAQSRRCAQFAIACGLIATMPHTATASDLSIAAEFFSENAPVTITTPTGQPLAATIRAPDGRILGYAFSTHAVAGSVGYAGRPLDIVAAVTPAGLIAGARIVAHEEPILVIGIPREAIAAYVSNFRGYDIAAAATVRRIDRQPGGRPHAVAGATITSTVIHDAILRSARAVLRTRKTDTDARPQLDRESRRSASWPELVAEESVRRLHIARGEAARMLGTHDTEPEQTFIDLWLTLASPPPIGENLLGRRVYESELARRGPDDELLLIAASGLYSFKGTQWRKSGLFDRIQIVQGRNTIQLRADDHLNIPRLAAEASPDFREIGLFRIAGNAGFDPTLPFRLDLFLDGLGGTPPAVAASLDYVIPDRYLKHTDTRPPAMMAAESGAIYTSQPLPMPLWQDIWRGRRIELGALAVMLTGLSGILIFQNLAVAHRRFYQVLRTSFLVTTFVFLGFIANAQLSIVNVVTFVHALLSGFRWELFLLDPLVFVLWSFVAISMLFWGRGVFCGWLCPFGALQELVNHTAQRLGIRQVSIPFELHERLWMIKYVIFLVILAVSLHSIMAAFGLAEIEPFKTAITMKFMRDWHFVAYAVVLLAAGIFIERFYCRYLCALGAALAIPARMRMFEWLKRYRECGAECHLCARQCTVQAIHPLGSINPNECIYCLKCQTNYFDDTNCLHLKRRAERRRGSHLPGAVATDRASAANGDSHGR